MGRKVKVRSRQEIQLSMLRVAQKVTRQFPKVFRYTEQNEKVNSQKGAFFLHTVFSPDKNHVLFHALFMTHSASNSEFM